MRVFSTPLSLSLYIANPQIQEQRVNQTLKALPRKKGELYQAIGSNELFNERKVKTKRENKR